MRLFLCLTYLMAGLLPACRQKNVQEEHPIEVATYLAEPQTIPATFEFVGEAESSHLKASTVYLELAFLRYFNGQNDYLTVIDAQRRLFQAQLDLTQFQANVFQSLIGIYKALGGGWVIDADYCLTRGENCEENEECS